MLTGKFKEAAACLYRPQRNDYTGETDRRTPFSIYETHNRIDYFEKINESEIFAFVMNYKALRKYHLERKYPFVFSSGSQKASRKQSSPADFSWVDIHRDLMRDRFYDETKIL